MRQIWAFHKTASLNAFRCPKPDIASRLKIFKEAPDPAKANTKLLYLLAVLVLLPGVAFAQADTGTIAGTVRDASGGAVADAAVAAKNTATSAQRTVQSGTDGVFTIPALAPALYELTISKTGFTGYKAQATVTVGSHVTLDAQLEVSGVSTTLEVVAGVGGAAEINTQSQEVSQIITPEQVENLPSLTRNPYDFVALAGNVSGGDRTTSTNNPQLGTGGGQNLTSYRGVGYSINGQRSADTEILLDGAENINIFDNTIGLIVPQDAVQEFRVITNNFDAQYGRAAGGIVNVSTKSGTNNFHGDAWEFNRLAAYTANTFDNNASGVPKGQYTRNQFGYDVGGPIKKDKLFFYQSTEWLRVRSAASLLAYVPDPAFLSLTAPVVQNWFKLYGPQTFTPVSVLTKGNPNLPFNAAGPFAAAVPAGTPVFDLVNYTAPQDAGGDLPQNTYFLTARLDYNWTQNTQLFFRYGRESLATLSGASFASPYSQYNVGETIYNNNFLLSASHTFSSNLLSVTKLSFFREDEANQYNTALDQTPTLFLDAANSGSVIVNGQPVQLPGFYDYNVATGGLPFGGPQNTIQIDEDLSWIHSKHTMKYGGQYNYIQLNRGYGAYNQAIEAFGSNSDVPGGLDNFVTGTLNLFQKAVNPAGAFPCDAGAYFGISRGNLITPTNAAGQNCIVSYPLTTPNFNRSDRYNDWAIYAEDSWRVTPKLTFNYGLRYEHFGVQHNNNADLDSNFYYGSGSNFFQQVKNGSVLTVPNSPIKELWKPRWGTAAPRIGFAYDIFGNGKTVLRGGYGITYARNFGNVTFNIVQNPPNNATLTASGVPLTTSNVGTFAGTCPTLPATPCGLPPSSPRDIDQNIQVAATNFWGMTLERQMGSKAALSLQYNGAHGVHLYDINNINEIGGGQVYLGEPLVTVDPNNPACSATVTATTGPCLTRPNQAFTAINNRGTQGFNHYNALNVNFSTQELGRTGLSILTNYTWAHTMDNLSTTFSETSAQFDLGFLDPRNPWLDYGNADYDVRHRLSLVMTWTEPFLKSGRGVTRQVAGGWSISPIFTARTGIPFSVWDFSNSLNSFEGAGIPRYVPTGPIPSLSTGAAVDSGSHNLFNILNLPAANSYTGLLGISDFGPYPAAMTTRGEFRGPGAWDLDVALSKMFVLTERFSLEFRAEAYDIMNHANLYVVAGTAFVPSANAPVTTIQGKFGGLGVGNAEGANHDERRFGQFALRLHF
jgi:outer membrane receptor protein involved in Fe transport